MINEPQIKRTYAFFDGQNLFYAAKEAFGYRYPNYAPWLLAQTVCRLQCWQLDKIFSIPEFHRKQIIFSGTISGQRNLQ